MLSPWDAHPKTSASCSPLAWREVGVLRQCRVRAEISLTFARLLASLHAMHHSFRTIEAVRSALSTRGNLVHAKRPFLFDN